MSYFSQFKISRRSLNGGRQIIFRFPNNYGASAVCHPFSYGGNNGEWEIAMIKFNSENNDDWDLAYDDDLFSDVLGHLEYEGRDFVNALSYIFNKPATKE